MGQCQAAVAEVITLVRRLDILFCCSSQGVFHRVALCILTTHTSSVSHCRHCRGIIVYLSIIHSPPRSIRNKLLRPRQHHQGCFTLDERKALRSCHTAIRDKWVTTSINTDFLAEKGSTAGHLGTPGLGAYCASQWAIEGLCDV